MKKLFSVLVVLSLLFLLVAVVTASDESQTVKGWVSDAKCGAKGANAKGAACTKKCIEAGEKPVLVSDADQKVLNIENPEAVKGHEGHHVTVTGHVTGDSIHVMEVKMM